MICKNCGRDIPDNATSCPFCLRTIKKQTVNTQPQRTTTKQVVRTVYYKRPSLVAKMSDTQLKWFNWLKKLPAILLFLNIALCIISGIVLGIVFESLLTWFLVTFIGLIISGFSYIFMKMLFSPTIISTECLMDLSDYEEK